MSGTASRSFHRPDIQGLRAVAVLLVFFSHAHWPPFGGGFIGVDVFLVISGYVITHYLLREYAEHGDLRLRHFYARRLQRLLPALLLMVLLVSCLIALLLDRPERSLQFDAAGNALFWVSNLFFYFTRLGYFDAAVTDNMFLHTWTLGVEEQFYLVWPLLLLLGLSMPWRRALPVLLGSVAVLALALCLYWSRSDPNAAFYMMPARGWQFAIGGLVAWWHYRGATLPEKSMGVASLSGLVLVLGAAAWLEQGATYPRLNALAPTLGAALILCGGGWLNRLLSTRPMVSLGDCSYGFYLWHWPVLVLFLDLQRFYPLFSTGLALLVTLVLAAASYYLVEQPLRKNRGLHARPWSVIVVSVVLMVCSALLVHRVIAPVLGGWDSDSAAIFRAAGKLPRPYLDHCDGWYKSEELLPCTYGEPGGEKTAVLLSDSIGLQWSTALEAIYRERGWRFIVLTKSACPIVNRSYYYRRIHQVYSVCDTWRGKAIEFVDRIEPDRLIIGSSGSYPFSTEEWMGGTRDILGRLEDRVTDIVLLAPSPALGFNGPYCLSRRARLAQVMPVEPRDGCTAPVKDQVGSRGIRKAAEDFENVHYVDLADEICPDGVCSARSGDLIIYRDSSHLTEQFVISLREVLEEHLDSLPGRGEG